MATLGSYLMDNGNVFVGIPYRLNSEKRTQILKKGCVIKSENFPDKEYVKEKIKSLYEEAEKRDIAMKMNKVTKPLYTFCLEE